MSEGGGHRNRVPNRLAEYRERLGLDQVEVAAALAALSTEQVALDAHAVSRHERGRHRPVKHYRRLYCSFYQADERDLWPAAIPQARRQARQAGGEDEPLLSAPWNPRGTVEGTVWLAGSDDLLERRLFMFLAGAALTAPAHQWLVQEPGRLVTALGGDRVTPQLVDDLEHMVGELRRMDGAHGGGLVLGLAEREFTWVAGLLDNASYDVQTGRRLYGALAQLGHVTGWMAQDAGRHAVAQRYYIAGLRAAHTADNRPLGAHLIGAMSVQAVDMGNPADALTLLKTADHGTRRNVSPMLNAWLSLWQSYGHAKLGDAPSCGRALNEAEQHLMSVRPGSEPSWLTGMSGADFTADVGRQMLRLGRANEAEPKLAEGLSEADRGSIRRRFVWACALAEARRQQGAMDGAAAAGHAAVELISGLNSARSVERLRGLCLRLNPHRSSPPVQDFLDRAEPYVAA